MNHKYRHVLWLALHLGKQRVQQLARNHPTNPLCVALYHAHRALVRGGGMEELARLYQGPPSRNVVTQTAKAEGVTRQAVYYAIKTFSKELENL